MLYYQKGKLAFIQIRLVSLHNGDYVVNRLLCRAVYCETCDFPTALRKDDTIEEKICKTSNRGRDVSTCTERSLLCYEGAFRAAGGDDGLWKLGLCRSVFRWTGKKGLHRYDLSVL